jgi:hypothetical protein
LLFEVSGGGLAVRNPDQVEVVVRPARRPVARPGGDGGEEQSSAKSATSTRLIVEPPLVVDPVLRLTGYART